MSTNMDGPEALIEQVLELPVEDLQTLMTQVIERLRPLTTLINGNGMPDLKYEVWLTDMIQDRPIQTIKAIRAAAGAYLEDGWQKPKIGLAQAKTFVDQLKSTGISQRILKNMTEAEAIAACGTLAKEGATGIYKPTPI